MSHPTIEACFSSEKASCASASVLQGIVGFNFTANRYRVGSSVSFRVHQAPEVARLAPPFRIHCLYKDVESNLRPREWLRTN